MKHFFTLIALISLVGCKKMSNQKAYFSGVKQLKHYTWTKLDTASGKFSETIIDSPNLAVVTFWNNDSEIFNNLTYNGKTPPQGLVVANVGFGVPKMPIGWYIDYEQEKTLTLWSTDPLDTKYRATYSVEKTGKKGFTLTAVFKTINGTYREVMEFETLSE